MYLRTLTGYKTALGPNHISTFRSANNLGILYADQGKLKEAEKIYHCALEVKKGKALVLDHTPTLSMISNLGFLYVHQGKLKETPYDHSP
jgi:Flp pilus assembly protein TadD